MTIVVIKTIMEIGPKKMKEEDTMRGNARILTVLLCLTLILGLCGCSCRHEWVDATCTEYCEKNLVNRSSASTA